MTRFDRRTAVLLAVLGIGLTIAGARIAGSNPPTAGFLLLLVVLFSATAGGLAAGIAASFAATISFNYFFIPPVHTFHVADPENWVALGVFSDRVGRGELARHDSANGGGSEKSTFFRDSFTTRP